MSTPATLCLGMIVRNDKANLQRCLDSLAGQIGSWMIGDAGSTDGTAEFIRVFFAERGLPGEVFPVPSDNLEQAWDAALDRACTSRLGFTYLLQTDAEMELMIEDSDFRLHLDAPCYDLAQQSGVRYPGSRLLRRDVAARPVERRQLAQAEHKLAQGVWCQDHASGARRARKRAQEIKLLLHRIEQDPQNARHWFCLAQTLRDAGFTAEAAKTFARRAAMGGSPDEAWYARLQEARCLLAQNDESGFLRAALAAYNLAPLRAEPLYDLARFYRERGMSHVSVLYSEAGLALDRPGRDAAFADPFIHTTGLREEYSIAAWYSPDPLRKQRGQLAADWLTLSPAAAAAARALARSNIDFYCQPARTVLPSFRARRVAFNPPEGWHATNPSVARLGDQLVLVQRCVNYVLNEDGGYQVEDEGPFATRNFLLRLHPDLRIASQAEILPPLDLPAPIFHLVLGFEDIRPFAWRGELWCNARTRQLSPDGWCEQVLARIDGPPAETARLTDWCVVRPEGARQHQMHWMPLVRGDELRFIAACDPLLVLNEQGRKVAATVPPVAAEQFAAASQAIAFDRGWLALIHETSERDGRRLYWHRFVWFDAELALRGVSRRFCWHASGVELAVGLTRHPEGDRLLISYGVNDCEAWLATVEAEDVRAILADTDFLRATGPGEAVSWQTLPPPGLGAGEGRWDRAVGVWETAA